MKKTENTGWQEPSYEAAVYLRLSKEDEDAPGRRRKEESESITNQKRLIREFIKDRKNIHIFREYVDDGYSGSDFRRPGFLEMMRDVKSGKVNLVIVKDLSRFGREYIEAGRYLQKIFPALGVRFIAVTDHYDSMTADGTGKNLLLPVKNFINDAYSADLSVKIKSHLESRRANGDYTGAYVSYGFLKDAQNPGHLVPDPEAGEVVRQIFCWKIDGMSNRQIADRLNTLGILSPAEYKRSIGIRYQSGFQKNFYASWSSAAVGRILSDPLCRGLVVQGKRERINHKIKKMVERPPEKRYVFFQESLALMGKEQFETMQCLLKKDFRARPEGRGVFPFSGTLVCPDCGRQMIRRQTTYKNKRTAFYICKTYNVEKGCSRHSVREGVLQGIVRGFFAGWAEGVQGTMDQEVVRNLTNLLGDGHRRELEQALFESRELLSGLLGDWQEGILTEEEYGEMKVFYEGRCSLLQGQLEEREKTIREGKTGAAAEAETEEGAEGKKGMAEEMFESSFQTAYLCGAVGVASGMRGDKYDLIAEQEIGWKGQVCRSLLIVFFDRIWIYEDKKVELVFRCRNPFYE